MVSRPEVRAGHRRAGGHLRRPGARDPLRVRHPRRRPRAGVRLAAALHTGECDLDGETISGTTVQIGALLSEAAAAGDVLVSNTVRDLVAGSGIEFVSRGQAILGARLGEWSLFEVAR